MGTYAGVKHLPVAQWSASHWSCLPTLIVVLVAFLTSAEGTLIPDSIELDTRLRGTRLSTKEPLSSAQQSANFKNLSCLPYYSYGACWDLTKFQLLLSFVK